MPYPVLAAGKEIDEKDCPLVRLSVQVAADCRVNIEESRGFVSLLIHRNTKTKSRKLRRDSSEYNLACCKRKAVGVKGPTLPCQLFGLTGVAMANDKNKTAHVRALRSAFSVKF